MAGIYYSKAADGCEVGRWNGKSIRKGSIVTKDNQIYLGKVIDKDKLIFYKRQEGYYRFNPVTLKAESVPDEELPLNAPLPDRRLRERNVIVSFGGAYFLDGLLKGIEYDKVLESIATRNSDTMYALLHFYLLSRLADRNADAWYQNSYARFLYPRANMNSQRISDFYKTFGSCNNRRTFFEHHIPYLLGATDDEYAILLDSTGCQNACRVPITKVSRHNNEINIEFRVILVIQRSTGLPVYHEIIPGNVVDSSTVSRIIKLMNLYGFNVTHVSGDAGYSCPSNIEKIILCGSDLIMRLNPTYDLYKKAIEDHGQELTTSCFEKENDIHYMNRVVRVIKVPSVIGKDEEGEDVEGYIYLCRDMQAFHSKSDHFMSRHGKEKGDAEEIIRECEKFGLFAIVGTEDLRKEDIIPVYYQRQGIEQFFDSAKNLGKMMPVRNRTLETIQGHMLMSFIAAFLVNVIKNRMNILDIPYVSVPSGLCQGGGVVVIDGETENPEYILEQEPESFASRPSPEMLFAALNFVGADVFENTKHGDNEIVPAVPYKDANVFFRSFGIPCPEAVLIQEGHKLCPVFKPTDKNTCNKKKIFAKRPFATSEELKDKFKKKKGEKEDGEEEKPGEKQPEEGTQDPKPKQGPGRKKGSKNKKTLAREAEMAARGETPIKRGRGRPLGAKDKKPRKRRAAK